MKTPKEIKLQIISCCWGASKNIDFIRKDLKSNWATVNKFVQELVDNKILDEIKVNYITVGYKVNDFIKEITIRAYEPIDYNLLDSLPELMEIEYPIREKLKSKEKK